MKRFDMSTILTVAVLIIVIVAGCAETQRPSLEPESHFERALAYHGNGQYDRAISDYNKAIRIDPRHAAAYYHRGHAYADKGQYDYDRAISDFSKAIKINPKYATAYYNRGLAYAQAKGEYDRAISDYSKAIELSPKLAAAYYHRGVAYAQGKGQYDQAISDYDKAIKIDARYAFAYNNRGEARWKLGNKRMACSDWKRACELGICNNHRSFRKEGLCD
jgi:tetratricopeptide (TPR) repeat protein